MAARRLATPLPWEALYGLGLDMCVKGSPDLLKHKDRERSYRNYVATLMCLPYKNFVRQVVSETK